MEKTAILLPLIFIIFLSCQSNLENDGNTVFVKPEVSNSRFNDSLKSIKYKANAVSSIYPTFAGKYSFAKSIDINREKRYTQTSNRDFIRGKYKIGLGDSIDVNGFEIIVDYEQTVKHNPFYKHDSTLYAYYPVFFVNSTKTDKIFLGKDGYAFGIQEALDNYKWKPIEGRGVIYCGNGHFGLLVHPQEFVVILMRKYKGDFETRIRVRFKVGESIYVSKPFKGTINYNQFSIPDSSYFGQRLKETNSNAATWLFYGAEPKKEE